MSTLAAPREHRKVLREPEGRLLGGVATGIATHLGLFVPVVRLAFVALTLAGGVGVVIYAAFWLLLPQSGAARHSGVDTISLYAEVGADRVEVFVRDRGSGFDPAAVPPDRFGISQSIVGRMQRHEGRASVRSSPGSGTEVRLEVRRG